MEYSWYETGQNAVIVFYAKNAEERENKIEKVAGGIVLKSGAEEVFVKISHPFELGPACLKVHECKIEAVLEKTGGGKWGDLVPVEKSFERNREIEQPEEEASNDPVLDMFRKVYENASDDAKREMNRSFVESKGTELRTTPAPRKPNRK